MRAIERTNGRKGWICIERFLTCAAFSRHEEAERGKGKGKG